MKGTRILVCILTLSFLIGIGMSGMKSADVEAGPVIPPWDDCRYDCEYHFCQGADSCWITGVG